MAKGQVNVPGVSGAIANEALKLAGEAKSNAAAAKATADAANVTAEAAMVKAATAEEAAGNVAGQASEALEKATEAERIAGAVGDKVDEAVNAANTAKQKAEAAERTAANAQTAANDAMRAVTKLTSSINSVPTQSGILTYTGQPLSPNWNGYDEEKLEISGQTTGTEAGTYVAVFTPKEGYEWADGSTEGVEVNWTINKASLNVPTVSQNPEYTGGAVSPAWSGYDTDKMDIGGTSSATNAGNYNATFSPKANYQWADGSNGEKTVAWTISKAAGSSSADMSAVTLTEGTDSVEVTVTRAGDGAITATSSDTSIAAVSVSGNKVTISSVNRKNGTAKVTIKVAAGTNHTAPADLAVNVTVDYPNIYGVSWDGTSTTKWTRTDNAATFTDPVPYISGATNYGSPFDNLKPWAGMVKSERTGGTMVAIPKFWYKLTQSGAGMKIQIADRECPGYSVSPAHMDRGDGKGERDTVYIGRYHCGATAYKSVTGQKPKVSITRDTARSSIHNLGDNIWQMDFAMRFTLWLLYLVEYADWNTQATIGGGCSQTASSSSAVFNMGGTDSMPYHTGNMQSSHSAYGTCQYRNIEGLWDNCYDWMDGCYYNNNGLNIIKKPADFKNGDSQSGGQNVGLPTTSGWPSGFAVKTGGGFPCFAPTASSGNGDTYSCDYWYFYASNPCLFVGGSYYQNASHGLFYVVQSSASYSSANVGCRLQELP